MNIAGRSILLAALLMCLLSGNASGYTSSVADNLSNRTILSQPRDRRFNFLFAQQTEDSVSHSVTDSIPSARAADGKLREPFKAFVFAVVPGVIAHGAGHFYAGKTRTGLVLLGSGLAGGFLMFAGQMSSWERSSPTAGGFAVAMAGGVLFFGSWIYDMVGAPLAVQKYNATLIQRKPVGMELRMREGEPRLAVVWRF